MLHVLENKISLREWSGGTAQLLIWEGTMISFLWILALFTHFHVSFASFENWVISVTKENLPRNRSNCFRRKKSPNFTVNLAINFSINLTSGFLFAFMLVQKSQKKEKDRLEFHIWTFLTLSEMHEANKNKYGLTKELFSTRMTKTTHVCSAIQLYGKLIDNYAVASEAQRKAHDFAMKTTVYRILLWETEGSALRHAKIPDSDHGL